MILFILLNFHTKCLLLVSLSGNVRNLEWDEGKYAGVQKLLEECRCRHLCAYHRRGANLGRHMSAESHHLRSHKFKTEGVLQWTRNSQTPLSQEEVLDLNEGVRFEGGLVSRQILVQYSSDIF